MSTTKGSAARVDAERAGHAMGLSTTPERAQHAAVMSASNANQSLEPARRQGVQRVAVKAAASTTGTSPDVATHTVARSSPLGTATPGKPKRARRSPSKPAAPAEPMEAESSPSKPAAPAEPMEAESSPSKTTAPAKPMKAESSPSKPAAPAEPMDTWSSPSTTVARGNPKRARSCPSKTAAPAKLKDAESSPSKTAASGKLKDAWGFPSKTAEPAEPRGTWSVTRTVNVGQPAVLDALCASQPGVECMEEDCAENCRQLRQLFGNDAVTAPARYGNASETKKPPTKFHVCGKLYTEIGILGKGGGSAKVFRVVGPDGCKYALKRVKFANLPDVPEVRERAWAEVSLLQKLQDCPSMIRLIGACRTNDEVLIVLELGETSLETRLRELDDKPNSAVIWGLWKQLLTAVDEIHSKNVVHGDLKPANFLFVNGVLKLIDLGIAVAIDDGATHLVRSKGLGTLDYIAPEVLEDPQGGQTVLARRSGDVWSLDAMFFRMVFTKPPFAHFPRPWKDYHILSPDGLKLPEHQDRAVQAVLEQCLQRDETRRPTVDKLLRMVDTGNALVLVGPSSGSTPPRATSTAAAARRQKDASPLIMTATTQPIDETFTKKCSRTAKAVKNKLHRDRLRSAKQPQHAVMLAPFYVEGNANSVDASAHKLAKPTSPSGILPGQSQGNKRAVASSAEKDE